MIAPTNDIDRGALQGGYVGVTAEVTAGAGLGANALIGGGIGAVTLEWVQ